jgi:hypothetical protein
VESRGLLLQDPTAADRLSTTNPVSNIPVLISGLFQPWYRVQLHDHYQLYKRNQTKVLASWISDTVEVEHMDDK